MIIIHLSFIFKIHTLVMVNLRCNDYGYECEYISEGEIDEVVENYKEHMNNEHGIDYSKESILEFIKRKNH